MIAIVVIVTYILCCVIAYQLFVRAWTAEHDLTVRDRRWIGLLSIFGPASALAAVVITYEDKPRKPKLNRVLRPRRPE